jgi:hypothetical protein
VFSDTYNPMSKHQYLRASKALSTASYRVFTKGGKVNSNRGNPNLSNVLQTLVDKYSAYLSDSFIFGANPARYYCIRTFRDG